MSNKVSEEQSKCVQQLREWIDKQPNLPKTIDDKLVLRFAHSCYYDMEKTKTTLNLFFAVRSNCTDLLTKRDPMSPQMQKMLKIINLGTYTISDNRCLFVWQINDPGLESYDYTLDAKLFFLTTDARFLDSDVYHEADIVLMDVRDITLRFLTKMNVSVARRLAKYQEDAIPIRLKQVHVVNAPPFIDKIYGVMKPFMKKEITELIHFHPPNSESLYKYIKKEDLPEDYGGTRPSMAEITEETIQLIMKQRENLIDENLWRVTGQKTDTSMEVGSFRTLAID
ncbi:alpha-tocopherol transfer protein-like [Pararge aegeria]|uniref:Jg14708 protein n=1 Tax=Pararge aegeria aegeria TaxID=348720 RepID=A0A8S4SLT5_9NEOP|nr:alpha-tocopherol transfer protein-like [Pararge aegeria]CAH2267238.1 jg14708 [Pararge aegeria aegeria]